MGSWSVYCGISQIAITAGNDCVILPLKKCSNLEYFPYIPATLPIFGTYDDYGGMEDIIEDDNTKLISEHFGITIQEFVQLMVDGKHTYERDEAKEIEEKMQNYDEMAEWRFMFIDRKVYDFMSTYSNYYEGRGHLDFGDPKILELIGFEYVGENENNKSFDPKRFKYEWKFGDKVFYSDGTWLQYGKESIHNFNDRYSALSDIITIPENKLWIGEKAMWQLWEHLDDNKAKSKLLYIIGKSRYDDSDLWEKLVALELIKAGKEKPLPILKTLLDKYTHNFRTFGNQLSELVTVRHNLHPMSGYFAPFVLYLTPQCGEYSHHQVLLDKFAEINKTNIEEDED